MFRWQFSPEPGNFSSVVLLERTQRITGSVILRYINLLLTLTLTLTRSQVGIPTVLTARVHRPYSDTM